MALTGIVCGGTVSAVSSSDPRLTATNTTISGTGPGNLAISGVLSGAGALTINRPQNQSHTGLTDLTGANTFAGGVTLQAGNLRV
ncbi:MAG TPA: hypothetical protein PKA98_12870, partial [Acidimicrobiales bacterium]|nr:hypothetical protein [Acidimicrobiales bacterium]